MAHRDKIVDWKSMFSLADFRSSYLHEVNAPHGFVANRMAVERTHGINAINACKQRLQCHRSPSVSDTAAPTESCAYERTHRPKCGLAAARTDERELRIVLMPITAATKIASPSG